MDSTTALDRLRAYARSKGWRKSRFAKEAGLSDTVLRDFDKPSWNPRITTVQKLEAIVPKDFER